MDLAGRVVLVTGGGNGIGRGTALEFAKKGSALAIADIDVAGAEKVAAEIEEGGGRAIATKADISSESQVNDMIEHTIAELGALDVLVNNAGVAVSGPADLTPIEDWRWVVDINMWPHVYAIRKVIPYFKERGGGYLVHVASAAGVFGTPGLAAYTMTKFAVYGLAESLAVALHGSGIGVSVVCPLFVATDITTRGRMTVDPGLGVDEQTLQTFSHELLQTAGIPAEQVGRAIVEAVEEGRFLVLPHPEVLGLVQTKWQDPEGFIQRMAGLFGERRDLFSGVQ